MIKLLLILFLLFTACSSTDKAMKSVPDYKIARSQVGPEPVYNPLRWVNPPDPLPSRALPQTNPKSLEQVFQIDLKNSTIEEASLVLASTLHYRSYCAASIAHEELTINTIGTIDEIVEKLENLGGIKIIIDHDSRAVRFLSGGEKKVSAVK